MNFTLVFACLPVLLVCFWFADKLRSQADSASNKAVYTFEGTRTVNLLFVAIYVRIKLRQLDPEKRLYADSHGRQWIGHTSPRHDMYVGYLVPLR